MVALSDKIVPAKGQDQPIQTAGGHHSSRYKVQIVMLLPIASPARTALPAAHFDRNAATPVTDLVH